MLYGPDDRPLGAITIPPVREARRSVLTSVVETRVMAGLQTIMAFLPDPDELMIAEGPKIYDKMRADDSVWAAEFQLMTRILGRPWDVRPPQHLAGDRFAEEVAEYCKGVMQGLGTDNMLEHLFRALRNRHAGGQLVYTVEDSTLVPDEFLPEHRDSFRFGLRGQQFVRIQGAWRPAEPFKWQTHVNEPEPEREGGRSIFSRVYYPWKFKRGGWDLWVTALDRFAVPSLAALFELANYDEKKARELADMLAEELVKIASGSVGALANVKDVRQIGGVKEVQGFDVFTEMCDRSIYRGILTVTLTVSEGKSGAQRGNTEVHDEAADEVAKWYAKQLGESVSRQTLAYAALLKFGEEARAVLPEFTIDYEEAISLEKVLEIMDRNFPVSRRAFYSQFISELEPQGDDDVFVNPRWSQDSGDGATDEFTMSFPKQDAEEVKRRLYTYFRDSELSKAFDRLRNEGATWDEALDTLEDDPRWGLSRNTIRNIVAKRRKTSEVDG